MSGIGCLHHYEREVLPRTSSDLENPHKWPDVVYLVRFPDGKFACNRASTPGPDPMTLEGLAVHFSTFSVAAYLYGHGPQLPKGNSYRSTYEEARKIAVEKGLDALFAFEGLRIVDVEYLR